MENVLVLYESKAGHAEKYARWIAESVNSSAISLNSCGSELLEAADLIIFGGGVDGSMINGLSRFEKKMRKYPEKKIIYFATGIRPVTDRTKMLIRKNNFGKKRVTCHYFRGGLDTSKLTPGDKTLIRIYCAMLKRRGDIHEEDREVLRCFQQDADYTARDQIQPLVEEVYEMFKKVKKRRTI